MKTKVIAKREWDYPVLVTMGLHQPSILMDNEHILGVLFDFVVYHAFLSSSWESLWLFCNHHRFCITFVNFFFSLKRYLCKFHTSMKLFIVIKKKKVHNKNHWLRWWQLVPLAKEGYKFRYTHTLLNHSSAKFLKNQSKLEKTKKRPKEKCFVSLKIFVDFDRCCTWKASRRMRLLLDFACLAWLV